MEKVENKLGKFLKYDNLCLKFDAYWDDRDSPSGDIHNLIVLYYLSDDTIQINEVPRRAKPSVLYKRLKLPKVGQLYHIQVLNVQIDLILKCICLSIRKPTMY